MTLLPLAPGIRPSSNAGKAKAGQLKALVDKTLKRDDYACRFCGFKANRFQRTLPWSEDTDTGLVTSCTFCEQVVALERGGITGAGLLIWLPEIGQAELNHLTRAIYIARAVKDKAAASVGPLASRAYDVLTARRAEAKKRLGTDDPMLLATALHEAMTEDERGEVAARIEGIRLLPAEKYMVRGAKGDANHLPTMIKYWTSAEGPFGDKPVAGWADLFKNAAAKAGNA